MPITLITGPANAGKAQVVMDGVRRHLAHGEEPLLVVPTRADAEHYLRELAGEGAAMGVRVERFAGLIGEAVRRAGIGEAVLGRLARERVLEALAARAPERRRSPGFVRALGELFAELQVRRVTPARLSAGAVQLARGGRHGGASGAARAAVRRLPRGARAAGAHRRRAARGARAGRSARAARAVGAHARAGVRLRRPHPAAAGRDRDARPGRRRRR